MTTTQSPWQLAHQEFECEHTQTEIRYCILSNGSKQYFEQCLACGQKIGSAIAHSKIPNKDDIIQFDEILRDNFDHRIRQRVNQLRTQNQSDWWNEYTKYLTTDKWFQKRKAVLKRDKFLCQSCLLRTATQVHHLTYDHVFNEPLFDLVSVCEECHETITNLDRERRNGN